MGYISGRRSRKKPCSHKNNKVLTFSHFVFVDSCTNFKEIFCRSAENSGHSAHAKNTGSATILHTSTSCISALFLKIAIKSRRGHLPRREASSAVFVQRVYCGLQASLCTTAFCLHQRYFRIVGTRIFISIGFATWSFIPASSAACLSSEKAFAVIAMMGMPAFWGSSIRRIFVAAS